MSEPQFDRLDLSDADQAALVDGARDIRPVSGLTHNFYRYPARFSPAFVRAAIETFTSPGDTVLDPYMGGGTSLVEALALGRHAVGVDISQLAEFVSEVKTTLFTEAELAALSQWVVRAVDAINMQGTTVNFPDYELRGYFKHLDHPSRWRLRRAIEQALGTAVTLQSSRLESFARCTILRTAQWALDGRRVLPSISEFRQMLARMLEDMVSGARSFSQATGGHANVPVARLYNRSAAGLEEVWDQSRPPPKLVVTSPPYPGIHVLYHRWQVDGRKETAAPFWIANKLDGAGSSYYTMGDRKNVEHRTYFESLRATTTSVVGICNSDTIFVQMVAFSNPPRQLQRYLETMESAGLVEMQLPLLSGIGDGRLWRNVPNRRWYAHQKGDTSGSQEVVLLHRKRSDHPSIGVRQPLEVSLAG